jgi:hypothetical protein
MSGHWLRIPDRIGLVSRTVAETQNLNYRSVLREIVINPVTQPHHGLLHGMPLSPDAAQNYCGPAAPAMLKRAKHRPGLSGSTAVADKSSAQRPDRDAVVRLVYGPLYS